MLHGRISISVCLPLLADSAHPLFATTNEMAKNSVEKLIFHPFANCDMCFFLVIGYWFFFCLPKMHFFVLSRAPSIVGLFHVNLLCC